MTPHSIRARITAWYAAILAVALVAAGAITYAVARREIQHATDAGIADMTRNLAAALNDEAAERHGVLRPRAALEILAEFRDNARAIVLLAADGSTFTVGDTPMARRLDLTLLRQRAIAHTFGFSTIDGGGDGGTAGRGAEARLFLTPARIGNGSFVIAVAQSLAEQHETLGSLKMAMLITAPLALLAASLGGYVLARKSLAPVVRMSDKARAIGATNLSERIEVVNARDELGELAATLNDLLGRLEESFTAQQRFMADASHELRSPVTILQGELDVTLSRDDRDAADYRESLEVMRRSVRRLTRIVRDLFLLARSDAGEVPLKHETLYLGEVASQTARAYRTVAAEKGVTLAAECDEDLIVGGDEDLLQRMIGNLIENAIRYAPKGTGVRIRCTAAGGTARLEVRDHGPGVPSGMHEQIFERFFRADPTRGAASGSGAGLGLPIARWIAAAHGGRLWLESSSDEGSVFVATLPLVTTTHR